MTEPMTEVGERAAGTTAAGTDKAHAPDHLLTIPEAAARIGVSQRTLYRLLKADNFAARTLTEHRQTVTGRRLTTLLPPDLVEEIARMQPPPSSPSPSQGKAEGAEEGGRGESSVNASEDADNDAANDDKNTSANADNAGETVSNGDTDTVPPEGEAQAGTLPAVVYQSRIRDLEAMNAELRADKERLYKLLEMAQGNLAREQTLRALPTPQEMSSQEREAPAGSSQEAKSQDTEPQDTRIPEAGDAPEAKGAKQREEPARGWWARLWGAGETNS